MQSSDRPAAGCGGISPLFYYGSFLFFAFFVGIYLIPDGDFWVHLAQGLYIVDHRTLPSVDVFSFTYAGQPWDNWEWLHNVWSALLWNGAGPAGIIAFRVFLIFALSAALFHTYRIFSRDMPISFAMVFLSLLLAQHRISDRPQLFAYVMTAVVMFLAATTSRVFSMRSFLLFLALFLFRNAHPSWVIGVAILCAALADKALRKEMSPSRAEILLLFFSFFALYLLTPFRGEVSHYLTLQSSPHTLHEWQSLFSLGPLLCSVYYIVFFLFSLLVLGAVVLSGKKRPFYSLLTLLLLANAYLHVRFIADAAIVGSALVVGAFPRICPERFTDRHRKLFCLSVLCLALVLGQANFSQLGFHRGIGTDADKVPLYAGEYIREHDLKGNYFGIYSGSTDFLMAYAYHRVKVTVDVRVPGLYPYDFAERYWNITNERDLRDHVLSLPLDYMVLGRPDYLSHQTHEMHVERILRAEGWHLYYFDARYAVYGAPHTKGGAVVEPFRLLSRWNNSPQDIAAAIEGGRFEELLKELTTLKTNTAGRDDSYRDILLSLYALPILSEEQKEKIGAIYDR